MARRFNIIQREPLLLAGLIVVIAAFFSVTTFAARAYHRKQEQFAAAWFARGEDALKRSRPAEAVDNFRNALAFSRDSDLCRLRLAQALMAARRPLEARAHLLSLWEKEPGDGPLNLELARLAAMWGDMRQALRYYHAATYGLWPDEPMAHRWQVQFELSEYLLKRNAIQDAQGELAQLVADLPPRDVAGQTRLGMLLLQAGMYDGALAAFRKALADQPNLMPALAGAGEAAFRVGDYHTARHYLLPIAAQNPKDQHSMELLNLSELVMKLDPFERGLPSQDRASRARHDFQLALARAQKCPSPAAGLSALLQQANSRKDTVSEKVLARNPDALERTMDLVFKLEKATAHCEPAGLEDKALVLLGEQWERSR